MCFWVGVVKLAAWARSVGVHPRDVLSDPSATVIVVEHRNRLARFGVEYVQAALAAQDRRIVIVDTGETADDLVRDMIEVLTSMCARLYGRGGALNRALWAMTAAKQRPDPVVAG
jgi:putative resolvase